MKEDDRDLSGLLDSPVTDEPRWPSRRVVLATGVVILIVGSAAAWTLLSNGGDQSGEAERASTASTVTTQISEPSLVLAEPPVFGGVLGPEPTIEPDAIEQPMMPIESLSLQERRVLEGIDHLEPVTRVAVGQVADTTYRVLYASGTTTFPDAPDQGEPSECYWIPGHPRPATEVSTDCHSVPASPSIVPLWSGIEVAGIYAWAGLPQETAAAVLVVDGSDVLWQRPRSGVAAFSFDGFAGSVELRALDAAGIEIGRADREPLIAPPSGPITGHRDYSDVAVNEIDWAEAWGEVARCMTEHGYDTLGSADSLMFLEVPGVIQPVLAVSEACTQGMGLPFRHTH